MARRGFAPAAEDLPSQLRLRSSDQVWLAEDVLTVLRDAIGTVTVRADTEGVAPDSGPVYADIEAFTPHVGDVGRFTRDKPQPRGCLSAARSASQPASISPKLRPGFITPACAVADVCDGEVHAHAQRLHVRRKRVELVVQAKKIVGHVCTLPLGDAASGSQVTESTSAEPSTGEVHNVSRSAASCVERQHSLTGRYPPSL